MSVSDHQDRELAVDAAAQTFYDEAEHLRHGGKSWADVDETVRSGHRSIVTQVLDAIGYDELLDRLERAEAERDKWKGRYLDTRTALQALVITLDKEGNGGFSVGFGRRIAAAVNEASRAALGVEGEGT